MATYCTAVYDSIVEIVLVFSKLNAFQISDEHERWVDDVIRKNRHYIDNEIALQIMHGNFVWIVDHFCLCYLNGEEVGDHIKDLYQDDVLVDVLVVHEVLNLDASELNLF